MRLKSGSIAVQMTPANLPTDAACIRKGYVRVSTEDQNPQLQFDALMRSGLPKKDIFVDIESGTVTERKEYQKLCDLIRKGAVDEVDIYRLDRLGRNHYELVNFFWLIEQHDVKIVSLTEPYVEHWRDSSWGFRATWDAIGEARYELLRLKERQRAGIEAAKALGKHLGRPKNNNPCPCGSNKTYRECCLLRSKKR